MYMFVYTLYKLSMSVYWYAFVWKCKLCLPVFVWWTCVVLYICMNKCCICSHVWMVPAKISCKLTGSLSLNKVLELNWIELELNWIELVLNWIGIELDWNGIELNWYWIELNWYWIELNWIELVLNWIELVLNWIGLELNWIELN